MPRRRDIRVSVRFSAEEWVAVSQAAGQADEYPSVWVRRAVLIKLARDAAVEADEVFVEEVPSITDRIAPLDKPVSDREEQRRQTRYEEWAARQPKKRA